jgi:hypothetical protein
MLRNVGFSVAMMAILVVHGSLARAQYGAYGWGGWGGAHTVGGSVATGMGNFAAGAGSYNVQTAQARSINAQTAMQWNQYWWEAQQAANQREAARMAKRQQTNVQAQSDIQSRIRNNPTPDDIKNGDALNVVLDDLNSPQLYTRSLSVAKTPIKGTSIRQIPFQKASEAITISLEQLAQGAPPSLKSAAFDPERAQFQKIVQELRTQVENGGTPKPETLQQAKDVLKAARAKVESTYPKFSHQSNEAENTIKALLGLLQMFQTPALDTLLADVDKRPDTTLGDLLSFMRAFNLRFGVAKTGGEQYVYNELYPLLMQLRDQASGGGFASPSAPPQPQPGFDSRPSNFFSAMQFQHLESPPPPPRPNPGQ